MPAPSPPSRRTTTWDAGMHEQYGTSGVLPLTCCCVPADRHRGVTTGIVRRCAQGSRRAPRFMNEGRGALRQMRREREGQLMRGRIGIAAVGLGATDALSPCRPVQRRTMRSRSSAGPQLVRPTSAEVAHDEPFGGPPPGPAFGTSSVPPPVSGAGPAAATAAHDRRRPSRARSASGGDGCSGNRLRELLGTGVAEPRSEQVTAGDRR